MSTNRKTERTDTRRRYDPEIDDPAYGCTIANCPDEHPVEVLRSDSGEHAVIVGATVDDGLIDDQVDTIDVKTYDGQVVRTVPAGRPIGILGLTQTALDDLAEPDPELHDVDPADLVAQRLAEYGVSGLPGSRLMHPVVEHVLRYTDAEQVRLVGDRELTISKFGITARIELPAAVVAFIEQYDGPLPLPYPGLYARVS